MNDIPPFSSLLYSKNVGLKYDCWHLLLCKSLLIIKNSYRNSLSIPFPFPKWMHTISTSSFSVAISWHPITYLISCATSIIYTKHHKQLITSSERHSLKSKALKLLIIGHRLAIVLLTKHVSKKNICFTQKGVKCSKITRDPFSKITETACHPGTDFGMDKSQYSYITCY